MTHVAAQARFPKRGLLLFFGVAGLLLLLGTLSVARGMVAEESRVDIVRVVDGSTVVVDAHGTEETLTMAGLVTSPRNPEGVNVGSTYCLGEESYAWLRDRLPQGAVATVSLTAKGQPEGVKAAVVTLGGEVVNVAMAEEGMAAPTGSGVDADVEREIADANATARRRSAGLYDLERTCTLDSRLYEATYALEHTFTTPEADTVDAIDERSVEYAEVLDEVRLIRDEIAALDPDSDAFKDLAWSPDKDAMLEEADQTIDQGLQVLRDLNARRNELARMALAAG